ncbi:MAG TPA: hypothetical protein VM165_03540 [Planctomycetaceae bacterium]|nr:hypothetical protein [Planctomycetaceae bacterium]
MANLTQAHRELFRRTPDECFSSLDELEANCKREREESLDRWHLPQRLQPTSIGDVLELTAGDDGSFRLNDWSFSQLCRLGGVSKETVNRVSADTAGRILRETLPGGQKPLQILTTGDGIRSVHGTAYSRLWNADLLSMVREFDDYQPPQHALNGATGLYCGEQDLFCFLIDPAGWTEIGGEHFAPGFFLWNSEVGKRSLGISSFWFQKVCMNHIVWDAVEVVEFTRKHTGNIRESLNDIRRIIEAQVQKRDSRRDGFAAAIKKAMQESAGTTSDEATKFLLKQGISRDMVKRAVDYLSDHGRPFTLWTLVDALTQFNTKLVYAGDRMEADMKVAGLLSLAV